ncbi:MAG TPA: PQQ-binding-like beta-propeller repeat protein, partial [Actinomycetota bacterium]|nr:PQQ-binding-like beta-propeller repeat protein [Actinomycetota bacterium]
MPTIDDRCEVSTSPMRGQVFPLDVAASASRVFSAITGGRVRGTDAATGAFSWETQLGAGVPGTFVTSVGVSPGGAGVFAGGTIGSSPTVTRLDPSTGAIAWSTTVPGVRTAGGELAVSADGKVVALTGNDNDQGRITTIGFDAATGDVLWRGDSDVPGSELV